MAIKRRRGEDQFSTTERNSAFIEFSINSIQIKRRNSIKNKRRWRRKRRRGERVEGVGDNYSNSFHQFERVNTVCGLYFPACMCLGDGLVVFVHLVMRFKLCTTNNNDLVEMWL